MPPTVDDGGTTAMEVGVKFTADTGGYITGIRFYKAPGNTGTHVGDLWTTGGILLATATFTGETASGWQQVDFAPVVLIGANTTYIASYHTNIGHTSDDHNYFTNGGVNNTPLHALQSGVSGGNGVYVYNAGMAFPTNTNLDSNYWVDVAFVPTLAVTPANPSIAQGATQQFTATGTYSDSSTQDVTSSVTWSSSNTAAATITSGGLATGGAIGNTTIQATSGSISGSTTLTVSATGLVGYWKFDEGSGTTAADSSGNGYTATLVNGVSWVAGKIGDALSANGGNQYVSIPTINLSGTSTVTVAFWANRTYSQTVESVLLEDSTNYNGSSTGFGFFPDDTQCNGIQAAVHGNVGYSVNCYGQPSSGVWHHLAVIYDKTQAGNNQTALYIDGVLQTPTSNLNTAQNTNSFGNNPIYLFSRDGTEYFNAGEMDDLRLYNRALSAAEIQQIYQAGSASLVSIAVTPANPSIVKGATQQFTATGTYNDSSTQNLTSSVTWSSTNTAAATITSGGLATGVGTGTTTIGAASGSINGTTNLTVTTVLAQGFAYRRAVTLTNSGSTLTNYQVKIALTSSNMNISHAKSDGSDVRVRASDGVTNLSYWIENWNSSSQVATVWANVPSIPNGSSTIYLVYGEASATTTASGTNTFLFFDDFSSADPSTLNGYYQESTLSTVNLGAAQAWEGHDQPHFFTVLPNPYGATLDGVTYTYWAWYGLHSWVVSGIGLAGSNDLVNWTKYSSNPVIPVATGCSRPSVILVSTTLNMACESTAATPQISYFTSTNGTSWTAQTAFTAFTYNAVTPQLWLNPNNGNYYLFYAYCSGVNYYVINYRTATTVAGLETAADNTILRSPGTNNPFVYAPYVTYDTASGLYVMQVETVPNTSSGGPDTTWYVVTLLSSSIDGPWTVAAGSPIHTGGYACPENYNASGTLYTYYCYYNGSAWSISYTTASVSTGLQQYSKPKTSLWTDVHDTTDTAPTWYLTPCTDWKGASATCLYGFGQFTGEVGSKDPMLQSSYSGTNYILDAQVYGEGANDAQIGTRMSATAANYYSTELYFNHNGTDNIYVAKRSPTWTSLGDVVAGDLYWQTWYQLEANPQGTTQEASTQYGTYTVSGTDSTYSSGAAGPSLELFGSAMFGYTFIRQYAATPPTNSVESEISGNY